MTHEELEHFLCDLSEEELALKRYYEEHGHPARREVAYQLIGPVPAKYDLSIWHNPALRDLNNRSSLFSEEHFFPEGTDLFFMKHNCYSHVDYHDHGFYEICYVHHGKCLQKLCQKNDEDKEILLHEGDFLFIAPGQKHTAEVLTDSAVFNIGIRKSTFYQTFYNQLPSETVLSRFFLKKIKDQDEQGYLLFRTGPDEPLWSYYETFVDTYLHPNAFVRNLLNLQLGILFIHLVEIETEATISAGFRKEQSGVVPAVIAFLEEHYPSVNVSEVSARFGYSADHLNRLFKNETGRTISATITEIRMLEARRLLVNTSDPVEEIADAIGYKDTTTFIRNFKKAYGCAPGHYRRNQ